MPSDAANMFLVQIAVSGNLNSTSGWLVSSDVIGLFFFSLDLKVCDLEGAVEQATKQLGKIEKPKIFSL